MNSDQRICIACQECCKWMTFTTQPADDGTYTYLKSYYEARGCKTIQSCTGNKLFLAIMVPHVCPQLTEFGCKDYDNRPEACRRYDGRADPLMKDLCVLPKEVDTDG